MEPTNNNIKLSLKVKAVSLIVILVLIVYWGTTIFFIFPSNYLSVNSYQANRKFDLFFFQRWGFFAPPPTFNERLYYSYYDKNNKSVATYEVLENIYLSKQRSAPFNKKEELMDYVLSNTVSSLMDYSREAQNLIAYENKSKQNPNSDSTAKNILIKEMESRGEFKTLFDYGVLLANQKGITDSTFHLQVKITRISIPQFEDRRNPGEEEMIFASNIHHLKRY